MAQIDIGQQATPVNPSTGKNAIYPKPDGFWYVRDSSGNEEKLSLDVGFDYDQAYFVAKSGSDTSVGTSIQSPFLTFSKACTEAAAQALSSDNKYAIICLDGGSYNESFTVPQYVQVFAPNATITGNIILEQQALLQAYALAATSGNLITKTTGALTSEIKLILMQVQGTANGIQCTSGGIICEIDSAVSSSTGYVIGGASTGRIDYRGSTVDLLSTGSAINLSGSADTTMVVNALNGTSATGLLLTSSAILKAIIANINCATAYNVGVSAHLDLVCSRLIGTKTAAGTVHLLEAKHQSDNANPHSVTKTQVGLGNVDNLQQIPLSQKGSANGVAELDSGGKVPSTQLPSYVDDVLEYANLAAFPATGETGKIYVALDTNKTYRWTGSAYIEVSPAIFGSEFSQSASESQSDYTGTVNYQQKLRHTTSSLPSGNYIFHWQIEAKVNADGRHAGIRVQVNDTDTLAEIDLTTETNNGGIGWRGVSGVFYLSSISGVKNIDIDYATREDSRTVSVRRARIQSYRIS